jgi:hypothetical protein
MVEKPGILRRLFGSGKLSDDSATQDDSSNRTMIIHRDPIGSTGSQNFSGYTYEEYLSQFFKYDHLPAHLQSISKPFGELAQQIVDTLPKNPERTVALRKLLEAKDCAVRAQIFK